jgi:sigma-54-interacting transcriptional regulator
MSGIGTLYNISVLMPDWRLLLSSRANLLLEGTDRAVDRIVTVLTPHFRHPVQTSSRWAPHAMPSEGTLILREVESLNADEQQNLLRWMEDAGAEVQVISVIPAPLFPLVVGGRFLQTLYYRLNVLYITADDFAGGLD